MDAFIDSLLERLLATSVQTALLTTAVWVLCRCVPRLSPSSQCWLWWLVALQAVLGLAVSPVELPLLPYATAVPPEALPAAQWDPAILVAEIPPPTLVPATGHMWITLQSTVFLVWLGGFLTVGCFTMGDWRRAKALVNHSTQCDDAPLLQVLASVAQTCGTRNLPELRLSAEIESPVLVGHRRPVLLLPTATSMSDKELDMVLAHELTHLRRGDLWWGVIPALARHLFFFHPFVHLAVREYGTAREAACDVAVVNSEQLSREDYGRLLVRLGTSPESRAGLAVASPTFRSLRARLTMLQHTAFLSRTGSIAVLAVAAVGVLPLRLVAAAEVPTPSNVADADNPAVAELPSLQRNAQKSLDEQIAAIERKLREDEARIAHFQARNADAAPTGGRGDNFSRLATEMAGVKQAESNLVQARMRQLQKQADAVRNRLLTPLEASNGAMAANGQELTLRLAAAKQKLAELRQRFKERSPDKTVPEITVAKQVIEELKQQEEQELLDSNAAWQSIQIELNKVQLEIATLQSVIEAHRKEIGKLTQVLDQRSQLEQLRRDYEVHKRQYELLAAKRAQVAGTADGTEAK
jgi:beta-lactamase regulating signal transducer with metallopeptidase domain